MEADCWSVTLFHCDLNENRTCNSAAEHETNAYVNIDVWYLTAEQLHMVMHNWKKKMKLFCAHRDNRVHDIFWERTL